MNDRARRPGARPLRAGLLGCLTCAALLTLPGPAAGAANDSLPADAGAVGTSDGPLRRLDGLGFENLSADEATRTLGYENRRYRHSADARGRIAARLAPSPATPWTLVERRLGLPAAAVVDTGGGVPMDVRYPSDREWTIRLDPRVEASTRRTVDLELVPILTYELGRIFDPVLVRIDLQPRVRYNPWPGARATASLTIPLRNDFSTDSLNPDIDRVRAGPTTLEQFGWIPGGVLVSGTGGIFGANRYGLSVGAARPLARGAFLLDAQADLTGYLAFPATGTEYSGVSRFTGFAGVTWRPPALDVALRVRAQRYLYADQGLDVEVRRSMGDLDVAFSYQRSGGFNVQSVRLDVPIPPITRPTGRTVRVLPVERMSLGYRDETVPVARAVPSVASREEFLRQLSAPSLTANAGRYRPETAGESRRVPPPGDRVSLTGTTGFINTPWCGVMSDRSVEVGYNRIPRGAAYDHRGRHVNDVYYAALGFLPRVEVGLRWTVMPGLKAFSDLIPDSRLTDSDRMLSGRIEILTPRPGRPGLALGIEDAMGTRRFHSTYAVTGIPFAYRSLNMRAGVGYAFEALTAGRHTLNGAFGAVEAAYRPVAVSFEHDSEKWNAMLAVAPGLGFQARAALLDMRYGSFGIGWAVGL